MSLSWKPISAIVLTLAAAAPHVSAQISSDGVAVGVTMGLEQGHVALVVGRMNDSAESTRSLEIESVVFGDLAPAQTIVVAGVYRQWGLGWPEIPSERSALWLLRRPVPPIAPSVDPSWRLYGQSVDFMPDGAPYCLLGPDAEIVIQEAPRMVEIAALGAGLAPEARRAVKREAVWSEWRKGEMRRSLVLGWILYLGLNEPKHKEETLIFLADLVNDRTMPPECRLTADSYLASPLYNRPDYANNTPARTALLIELLAHPELPEHTREQAERTLADLSRRLEAESAATPTPQPQ